MLIKSGSQFKINDYYVKDKNFYIETNINPNFDILRQCGSLMINNETKQMIKTAKIISIAPKCTDFLYVRNRAISASNVIDSPDGSATPVPMEDVYHRFPQYCHRIRGANDNADAFSHTELQNSYKTFIGKSVFVDHNNDNVEQARGIILDAIYNTRGHFVELLLAIDKKAYPELARGIEMGYITGTSMGTRVQSSICSICLHESHTEEDFCDHVKHYKGSTFNGLPVWEWNIGAAFIEDSLVSTPADASARIIERVASRTHPQNCGVFNKAIIRQNSFSTKLQNEQNQRTYAGQVKSIFDELNDLPWS